MSDDAVLREADFASAVSILASKYNCTLIGIDFESETIDLAGKEEDVDKCEAEIKRIFDGYV